MDDPWNEHRRPHPVFYCFVIVVCAAVPIAWLVSGVMGVAL